MSTLRTLRGLAFAAAATLALAAGAAKAAAADPVSDPHQYPTADRVTWVEQCMREHPGMHYEMLNKCSCVLDTLARQLTYDDFTTMTTAANATTIGGERGSAIRDAPGMQDTIKQWKKLLGTAQASCFIQ